MGLFSKKEGNVLEAEEQLPEHYDSIDTLPMLQWNRIHKDSDITHLLIKRVKISDEQKLKLALAWNKIYEEYISVFGFSDQLIEIVELERKIARLKMKLIITEDRTVENFIRAFEKQLSELREKVVTGDNDIYTTKNNIEKYFGNSISMVSCPVREFYSYLHQIKKENVRITK